jgi:hypothetical protein
MSDQMINRQDAKGAKIGSEDRSARDIRSLVGFDPALLRSELGGLGVLAVRSSEHTSFAHTSSDHAPIRMTMSAPHALAVTSSSPRMTMLRRPIT